MIAYNMCKYIKILAFCSHLSHYLTQGSMQTNFSISPIASDVPVYFFYVLCKLYHKIYLCSPGTHVQQRISTSQGTDCQ